MSISVLLLLLVFAPPAWAGGISEVVASSLGQPAVPYEGEITVVTGSADKKSKESYVRVKFLPPGKVRREVVDRRGFLQWLIISDGEREWNYNRARNTVWQGLPADPDEKLIDPDEEIAILERNYKLSLGRPEHVAGRLCDVLTVTAKDGAVLRRTWVERSYGLVLQRLTFHPDGREASRMMFTHVQIPAPLDDLDFAFSPPRGARVKQRRLRPEYLEVEEAEEATGQRPRTPAWLPPGYSFESVNLLPHRGTVVLHTRYTDGLDVLSLFQAPAQTEVGLRGTSYASVGSVKIGSESGRMAVGSGGKLLEWAAGQRFALLGSLPWESLKKVAESIE
jgi:outer membrane lipoprotein-sorting protein